MKNNEDKISRLFLPSGCLREETIELYLGNGADEEEKLAIDEHLAKCELCATALGGYRILLEEIPEDEIPALVLELKEQITAKAILLPRRRYIRPLLAMAAMLIILFASLIIFRMLYTDREPILAKLSEPQVVKESSSVNTPQTIKQTLKPEVQSDGQIVQQSNTGKGAVKNNKRVASDISPVTTDAEIQPPVEASKTKLMEEQKKGIAIEDISSGASGVGKTLAITSEQTNTFSIPPGKGFSMDKYNSEDEPVKQDTLDLTSKQEYISAAAPQSFAVSKASKQKLSYRAAGEPVYLSIEIVPQFPGGPDSLNRFIKRNLKFPNTIVQGTVYVSFYVETDGSLSEISIKKGIGGGCDEEAIRLVKMMPKWIPAKQNEKVVRSLMVVPVKFNKTLR